MSTMAWTLLAGAFYLFRSSTLGRIKKWSRRSSRVLASSLSTVRNDFPRRCRMAAGSPIQSSKWRNENEFRRRISALLFYRRSRVRPMRMKQYLIDTFQYNDYANKLALNKIKELPEKDECIRFFSHLINSMNKWLARINQAPGYAELDWWLPVYELEQLEAKWEECLKGWIDYLVGKTDEELDSEVDFIGYDSTMF